MKNKAYAFVEYAFLISLVITGIMAMSVYFRRAISGKWKDSADSFGYGLQYEPGVTVQNCSENGIPVNCFTRRPL